MPALFLRTWTATDACGLTATCVQTITITNEAPTLVCDNLDVTITCNDPRGENDLPKPTATDDCTDVTQIALTFVDDESGLDPCGDAGFILRTWTATDACGLTATCVQTITITNEAPTLVCDNLDVTIECDASFDPYINPALGRPMVRDDCSTAAEIDLDYTDAEQGTPECNGNKKTILRTWTATDACGLTATCVQTIQIDDRTPPQITCPTDATIECDEDVNPANNPNLAEPTATDNCSDAANITFSYIDNTDDLTLCGANTGQIQRTWTATDECGNMATCIQIITVQDNIPPTLDCSSLGSPTVECDEDLNPDNNPDLNYPTVSDNCSDASNITITYNDDRSGLNECGGNKGTIIRTFIATDECGNTATCTQTIFVDDTTPPTIDCPETLTVSCNGSTDPSVTGMPTALDNCTANPTLTHVDSGAPSGTGCEGITGSITRTWTATDECGNTTTCVQIINIIDDQPPVINCPVNSVTLECDEDRDPANNPGLNIPTATDDCTPTTEIDLTYEDNIDGLTECNGNQGFIIRTWTATDLCGNTATCTQRINIQDTTAPTLEGVPDDITVSCEAIPEPVDLSSLITSDNCDNEVEILFEEERRDGTCPYSYTIIRTWIAIDDCDNRTPGVQIIVVTDDVPPVINNAPTGTISVDCNAIPDEPANVTATDNCSENILVVLDESRTDSEICIGTYTLTRTWTATDDCGNSSQVVQIINVTDNTPPVATCDPIDELHDCNGFAGNSFSALAWDEGNKTFLRNCTTDDCSGVVVTSDFNYDNLSDECGLTGSITVTYTVADDCGNNFTKQATFTVQDTAKPTVNCNPTDLELDCDNNSDIATLAGNWNRQNIDDLRNCAFDNCGTSFEIESDFDFNNLTNGCAPGTGEFEVTYTVRDECGNFITKKAILKVVDDTAPVVDCLGISVSVSCTDDLNSVPQPSVADACTPTDQINLTFTDNTDNLDPCGDQGFVIRTWIATDECGNTATCEQVITIINMPPVLDCSAIADITIGCDEDINTTPGPSVTDDCTPVDQIQLTSNDDTSNLDPCGDQGFVIRTWTATDLCGNTATCTQVITITNEAPVLDCSAIADITIGCDEDINTTPGPSVTDDCTPVDQIQLTSNDDTSNLDPCGDQGFVIRTWTATDLCGNTATCTQVITITNEAPVLDCSAIADITIGCDEDINTTPRPIVTDDCTPVDQIQLTSNDDTSNLDPCGDQGFVIRTWTATDECGNTATCTQVITITNEAPVLDCAAIADITIGCDEDINAVPQPIVTDDCTPVDQIQLTSNDDTSNLDPCGEQGFVIRTWTATDDCGNTATCQQVITITNEAPVLDCAAIADITIGCDEDINTTPGPIVTDDCTPVDQIQLTSNDDTSNLDPCGEQGFVIRTWTATDDCGNTATCQQVITITNEAPVLDCAAIADITIGCDEDINTTPQPSVTDDCTPVDQIQLTSNDDTSNLDPCGDQGFVIRTWTATDGCGNTATC